MFVDKRIHVYQKQKGTTRRNQRNESTSISFIWTILSLPLHARLIEIPFLRRHVKDSSEKEKTNRHVFLRHVFFSDTTIPIFDSPSFAYRPPIFDPSEFPHRSFYLWTWSMPVICGIHFQSACFIRISTSNFWTSLFIPSNFCLYLRFISIRLTY